MISIKTEEEIKIMKEGGRILAEILKKLEKAVKPGITTWSLEEKARELVKNYPGAEPAFFNYRASWREKPFDAYLCISINDEVVHGRPSLKRTINSGDIVNLDFGIKYKNYITDSAITVLIENGNSEEVNLKKKLIDTTKECLYKGIAQAKLGNTTGDIGYAIQRNAQKNGFSVVHQLVGHGVGEKLHEEPEIPNFGFQGKGKKLEAGTTIAIEPMLTIGKSEVIEDKKTLAWKTKDGSLSAHFEHTVAITKDGPLVLTR